MLLFIFRIHCRSACFSSVESTHEVFSSCMQRQLRYAAGFSSPLELYSCSIQFSTRNVAGLFALDKIQGWPVHL